MIWEFSLFAYNNECASGAKHLELGKGIYLNLFNKFRMKCYLKLKN
jgi:hypothetical protein